MSAADSLLAQRFRVGIFRNDAAFARLLAALFLSARFGELTSCAKRKDAGGEDCRCEEFTHCRILSRF